MVAKMKSEAANKDADEDVIWQRLRTSQIKRRNKVGDVYALVSVLLLLQVV